MIFIDDGYIDTANYAIPFLDELRLQSIFAIAVNHIGKSFKRLPVITADTLKVISEKHVIACHGMSHVVINKINFQYEVVDAKKRLEDIINKPINHFIFPYDKWLEDKALLETMKNYFTYMRPNSWEGNIGFHLVGKDNPTGYKYFTHIEDFKRQIKIYAEINKE